ncbi:MAG: glycosyltransferase family 2 protein [Bacteroidales bacterium]|nr:glycosyltransferase family 2 protein [Bacteroidales bacterium]
MSILFRNYISDPIGLTLFIAAITCFVLQIVYIYKFQYGFVRKKNLSLPEMQPEMPPVSIVICMRDEMRILRRDIGQLLNQEYPDFEIVVVNMSSSHNGPDTDTWAKQIPQLTIVNINEKDNFSCSKLFPLSLGIKAAKSNLIITTDLNCIPTSVYWLRSMVTKLINKANVAGIANYAADKTFLNRLMRYEMSRYNIDFLSFLANNTPYSISTKNFLFKKSDFLKQKDIVDYFSVNTDGSAIFNKIISKKDTNYIYNDYSQINMTGKPVFSSWCRNITTRFSNMIFSKWVAKAIKFIYIASLIVLFTACALMMELYEMYAVAIALIVIRAAEWSILRYKALNRLGQEDISWRIFLYEPVLWFLYPILYLSSLRIKKRLWT